MIPFFSLPDVEGPGWDPVLGPDLKASDGDRDVAADMLGAAVADGRITLAEFDQRLGDVLAARTLRAIALLLCDLPDTRPAAPAAGAVARPVPAPAESRWSLLQSLVARPAVRPRPSLAGA
ncbi:MAG: DUF1707 domain-containing protein [Actinobacteria bacterium]|nr:DUF1707 domain-containing protein [Actinomycetota bacterium]